MLEIPLCVFYNLGQNLNSKRHNSWPAFHHSIFNKQPSSIVTEAGTLYWREKSCIPVLKLSKESYFLFFKAKSNQISIYWRQLQKNCNSWLSCSNVGAATVVPIKSGPPKGGFASCFRIQMGNAYCNYYYSNSCASSRSNLFSLDYYINSFAFCHISRQMF